MARQDQIGTSVPESVSLLDGAEQAYPRMLMAIRSGGLNIGDEQPRAFRLARKCAVAVAGFSVLGFGVALIVLPGPALLVIPLGLAILATEFIWARKLLDPIRKLLQRLKLRAWRVLASARSH